MEPRHCPGNSAKMKKQTIRNPFLVTLAVVFLVVFTAFRYFESRQIIDSYGVWNTMLTALILSAIPAIIIYMAWRYLKK
jgi:uncharacterized membrane protein (DUF4010 family)